MRAAPRDSAHAQVCGQPQLRSTPETWGATRRAARENSIGEEAPNWTIVGMGWVPKVRSVMREMVDGRVFLRRWLTARTSKRAAVKFFG